jgi:subtilase family serine protease
VKGLSMTRRRARRGGHAARGITAGLAGVAVAASFVIAGAAAQADTATVRLGAATPVPQGAVHVGALPAATRMRVDVVLSPRNAAALSQYATAVSTPGNRLYHDYLARGQFAKLFGPTSGTIRKVMAALRAEGLKPGAISSNHLSIPVRATAAQFEAAFRTSLVRYRLPSGRVGYHSTRAPALPAAIASHVQAVIGLDNLAQMQPLMTRPSVPLGPRAAHPAAPAAPAGEPTGGPQPCAAATNEQANYNLDFGFPSYTADELAWAYDFSPLYGAGDFGQGETVAIVEFAEPFRPTDIQTFQACYGTNAHVTRWDVDGYRKTGPGEGEAALDIEVIASMAPKANIEVFEGPNTGTGSYDVYGSIVAQDKARVVSVSWGLCEHYQSVSQAKAINVLMEQADVQGQTVVASSGDQGSEACLNNDRVKTRLSVNFPASDPYVLGVGGTAVVTLPGSSGTGPFELVWNDHYDGDGAGGGGKSTFFSMPGYQQSFLHASGGVREVPDVSANADPETGYVVYHTGGRPNGWQVIGGTSAAAPLWAALMTLTDNRCPASPVGFANPAIYYAASPAYPTITMDDIITNPSYLNNINNDYTGKGGGHYAVKSGYDMATGIGSPLGAPLAQALCTVATETHGYRVVTKKGNVYSFNATSYGSVAPAPGSPVVGIATDPSTGGYWVVTSKGHVYGFNTPTPSSITGSLGSPVVGIAASPSGGYWLVTAKGHVYAFDGAPADGSVTGHLAAPVVGIAADSFTGGYWIVTSKGHVYAKNAGAYPNKALTSVTAIGADPAKQGYWLLTSAGHIYGFHVNSFGWWPLGTDFGKVIGITGDGGTGGYWAVSSGGHVGAFLANFHGDHPGLTSANPAVGIAGT